MELPTRFVGGDAHIAPATQSDDTEIQCEFDGTQWGDVRNRPYANLENFHTRIEKLPRSSRGTGGVLLFDDLDAAAVF